MRHYSVHVDLVASSQCKHKIGKIAFCFVPSYALIIFVRVLYPSSRVFNQKSIFSCPNMMTIWKTGVYDTGRYGRFRWHVQDIDDECNRSHPMIYNQNGQESSASFCVCTRNSNKKLVFDQITKKIVQLHMLLPILVFIPVPCDYVSAVLSVSDQCLCHVLTPAIVHHK